VLLCICTFVQNARAAAGQVALALEPVRGGCAADLDPTHRFEASALFAAGLVPWSGARLDVLHGDPVASADASDPVSSRFVLRTARLGACGRVPVRVGAVLYDVGYEPWDSLERARPDGEAWGRFTAARVGWTPWSFVTVWGGIQKVPFSFGREQPESELALPFRASEVRATAPDRRLGLTVALDFTAVKLRGGVFESVRSLAALASTGVYAVGRLVVEPIGPVGPILSTRGDSAFWRARPRVGLGASVLYEWTPEPNVGATWSIAGDVPFKWGPLGVVGEFVYDTGTVPEWPERVPAPRLARMGANVDVALMVVRPRLELAGRWEWLDAPNAPSETRHAAIIGATLYALGMARLQLAYGHQFVSGVDRDYLILMLTIAGGVGAR
jgi:hypothetical protein